MPILVLLLSVLLATPAVAADPAVVRQVAVRVDRPLGQEEAQLQRYLEDLVGWPANERTAKEAEQRVLRLGRYASVVCRVSTTKEGGRLKCGVARARIIRNIRFEGLPPQILETDIRKRLFLRPGEPLSLDEVAGRGRITRQRERLEDYLVREGYYGAEVEIRTPPISKSADVEVVVRVKGGNFVRVREVEIGSWLPLSRARVFDEYYRMCSGGDGWLALFETWEWHCYTRTRLRETTERLEEQLRERGFPEGRVVVKPSFVEPRAEESGSCGWSAEELSRFAASGLPVPPRCVDLEVNVVPGRHLVSTLVLHDDGEVRRRTDVGAATAAYEWLAERVRNAVFAEDVSRALQLVTESPVAEARDTKLRLGDLKAQLTFSSSGALDATEVELSRRALLSHLASRGYLGARIETTRTETEDRVEVRFEIWPGQAAAIEDVLIVGNARFSDEAIREAVELAAQPRTLTNAGFITAQEIEDDVQRLFRFYEDRGYRDATVSAQAAPAGDALAVTFYIEEGEPYLIGGARMRGGDPAITPQVLAAMVHCQGGTATRQKRPALTPKDCVGSPLRPEELAADAERVRAVYARAGFPYVDVRVALSPDWTEEGPILEIVVWQRNTSEDDDDGASASGEPPGTGEALERPVRVSRGEIFLEGNFRTERHAILNEMGLSSAPEPRLDPLEISEGVSRLRRTGLFSRVDYEYVGREDQRQELDVVVQLEERSAGTIDLAAAYSTQDLGQLRAEWRDRNLFGLMLDLGVRADYGLFIGRESRVEAPFRWPRILGSNVTLRVEPSVIYSDHPSIVVPRAPPHPGLVGSRAIFHALTRRRILSAGGSVGVEWASPPDFVPGLSAGVDYELRAEWDDPAAQPIPVFSDYPVGQLQLRFFSPRALRTVDGLLTVFEQPLSRVGVITPSVRYNGVQNPFDPTSGWTGELSFSFGHPVLGASTTTLLLSGRGTYYWPFAQSFVLALHGRAWGGVTEVAPGDRSFLLRPDLLALGGDRTVRGYAPNEPFGVSGLAAEVAAGTRSGVIPLIGALGNAEVRWTAARNVFLGDLKLAGFLDAGFVTDDTVLGLSSARPRFSLGDTLMNLAEEPRRVGVGVGVGVRYVLPVGPLSFDVAYAPLTQNVQAHLQFGYAF